MADRRLPDIYVTNPRSPAVPGRASPAGQSVLSGRASMLLVQGATPIAVTDIPDGRWCVIEHTERQEYTDDLGLRRHYETTKKYLMVGVAAAPTIAETVVAQAVEDTGLAAIARELEAKGKLRPMSPREQWTRHEIPGRELYEHLCLQWRELFGSWVDHPPEPDWLTAWRNTNRDALTSVDAGGVIRLGGGRGRG